MTTTITRPTVPHTNGANGAKPPRIVGARTRRMPWVALGVVLVLVGALVFGLVVQSAGDRVAVVVAARDLDLGQIVEARDLRVVDIAIDGAVSTVPAAQLSSLVGQSAVSRIPSGTVVSRAQFARDTGLPPGQVVVGALLGPGALPVPNLRVGDAVTLIEARDQDRTATAATAPLGDATVFMVTSGTQPGMQFVSLAVDDDIAQKVADAAASQRLRLVLRPGAGG